MEVKVEGEFKKRIILMIGEGKYDPQRVEYLGKVSDMIEEAGKEFPETTILEILKPIVSDEVLQKVKSELYKYPQWFEKWLGKIEESSS